MGAESDGARWERDELRRTVHRVDRSRARLQQPPRGNSSFTWVRAKKISRQSFIQYFAPLLLVERAPVSFRPCCHLHLFHAYDNDTFLFFGSLAFRRSATMLRGGDPEGNRLCAVAGTHPGRGVVGNIYGVGGCLRYQR